MEDAFLHYEASRWLWLDSPILAAHGTRVLIRLGSDRAHRGIDARLLYPYTPTQVVASVAGNAAAIGSRYVPSERVVQHLIPIFRRTKAGGIQVLLDRSERGIIGDPGL